MDETLQHVNPNPMTKANWFSQGLFCWLNPLFKTGYQRPLEPNDLYNVVPVEQSANLSETLEREWDRELEKAKQTEGKEPSLFWALFRAFGTQYILMGLILLIEEGTKIIQPLFLGGLIQYFIPNSDTSKEEAYLCAMGLSLCACLLAVAHHPYFFTVQRIGMRMRIACCSLMYKKCLRLSHKALGETTTGQIINLMSNDVNRFDQAVTFLHFLWVGPLQAITVLVILWRELGPSVLAGFLVLILFTPLQGFMGKVFSRLRQKTAVHTDERVNIMNEIISGMRIIKMYCWEKPFGHLVEAVRRWEVLKVRKTRSVQAFVIVPFFVSSKFIQLLMFGVLVTATGVRLTAYRVFLTLGMLQALRLSIMLFMSFAVMHISEMSVVFSRVKCHDFEPFLTDGFLIVLLRGHSLEAHTIQKQQRCNGLISGLTHVTHHLFLWPMLLVLVLTRTLARPRLVFMGYLFVQSSQRTLTFRITHALRHWLEASVSVRRVQIRYYRKYHRMTVLRFFLTFSMSKLLTAVIVTPYLMTSARPRAAVVFTTLAFIMALHRVFVAYMSAATESISSCLVTVLRLQKFLMLEEVPPSTDASNLKPKPEDCRIEMTNFCGQWNNKLEQNTLQDISLKVAAGQLIAIIGPVGSGKSSLLLAILGELPALKGTLKSVGRVAYVSQQAWIFSGSVRQNILFGAPLDKAKYDRIVQVAALKKDFEIMPQGDATLIGDRGVSLSGGQKARISLARSLYMDADVYLLDDPLSAVDAIVGRHIFDKCIVQYLRKKPRILVTHQVQYLPVADNILILKDGQVTSQGSFDELSQSGVDFSELLKQSDEEHDTSPLIRRAPSCEQITDTSAYGSRVSIQSIADEYVPEAVSMPEEEGRARGTVGMRVYMDFFKAGSGLVKFLFLILVNLLAQALYVGSDWWLSRWSNEEESKYAAQVKYDEFLKEHNVSSTSNITVPDVDSHFNIGIYTAIIATVFLFGLARALLFFHICINASQNLHNRMFHRILRSPISFFDTNPVGRVLNRFSKDIGHMDDILPVTFFDFVQVFLLVLGIFLVTGIVNPYVFIPTVPLLVVFVLIRSYYLRTSRSIKRLEGTLRSPVFSHLSASIQGLATIRSMRMETKCTQEFDLYQDRHSEAWFLCLATSRWLAVRLDWLSAFFVTVVTFCSLLVSGSMNPGLAGLSITYSMSLMGVFQWGVRQSAEVENQMVSVERVLDYTRLPEEANLESKPDRKPPPSWPQEGQIEAQGVSLQYSPSGPCVLKQLNFVIKPQEKIGIVGRTGAGKSSLISALFRMSEPSGQLKIDGVDILGIGLHDLRKVISIIPQDPFLFSGPLRKNLDPFSEHDDDHLWKALEEVQLKDAVNDLPNGLESQVSEGGSNFSVGQRQLICLARAVLRHNRILLIDEATANVDPITDECIQGAIRSKFRQCTVLTIAHRLHTIMDSDRVMVLSEGSIVEFNKPVALLTDSNGYFYTMAQQTGKTEFEHLLELAKAANNKREEPRLKANGTVPNKEAETTDNTLNDISLSLNENPAEDKTYDISDIEDSLLAIGEEDAQLEEGGGEESDGASDPLEKEEREGEDQSAVNSSMPVDDDDDDDNDDGMKALLPESPPVDLEKAEAAKEDSENGDSDHRAVDATERSVLLVDAESKDAEDLNSSNSVVT